MQPTRLHLATICRARTGDLHAYCPLRDGAKENYVSEAHEEWMQQWYFLNEDLAIYQCGAAAALAQELMTWAYAPLGASKPLYFCLSSSSSSTLRIGYRFQKKKDTTPLQDSRDAAVCLCFFLFFGEHYCLPAIHFCNFLTEDFLRRSMQYSTALVTSTINFYWYQYNIHHIILQPAHDQGLTPSHGQEHQPAPLSRPGAERDWLFN